MIFPIFNICTDLILLSTISCSFNADFPFSISYLVFGDLCEYMFFRALLKGLFETTHLNKDCVFGSTNNLGTFKMNYWVLGLREAMIVVKPSGILFVHRPALKSLLG